jgi:hypothetical protein
VELTPICTVRETTRRKGSKPLEVHINLPTYPGCGGRIGARRPARAIDRAERACRCDYLINTRLGHTRAALDKALDEGFAASGMPGVTVGLWIPAQGSWVASRGVAYVFNSPVRPPTHNVVRTQPARVCI